LLKKTILPIILTTFLTAVFNRIFAGSWYSWFVFIFSNSIATIHKTPLYLLLLAAFCVFVLGLAIYHLKRTRALNMRSPITFFSVPLNGYKELGYYDYMGVKWLLRLPNPIMFPQFEPEDLTTKAYALSQDLNIRGPFCPKCQTELAESARFFGGYLWRCDMCRFTAKSDISSSKAQDKAEKVFQSQLRRQITQPG